MSPLNDVRQEDLETAKRVLETICKRAFVGGPADLKADSLLQLSYDAGRYSVLESVAIEIERRKKK